ncbi:MAG TPA: cbb3-type cytochrome c oxidase subunit 3 [Thiohalobacter sp.]|nr:cbb3-type cytochrome c oxidase subunit 3 [Thiohalobacter sp.]
MSELLRWIGQFENSKILALLIFFVTFCAIIIYVFTGKRRRKRLESYKYIPFEDDKNESRTQRKVNDDE